MTEKEKRELKDGVISIFKSFNILDHTATIGVLQNDILECINSMQEEPASEELEQAAVNAFKQIVDSDKNNFLEIFKAGAEWGKNQAMTEIQAQSMALAHGCPEENTSNELKVAADNALESITDQYDIISVGSCLEMFRLGAEWQKIQEYACYEEAFEDGAKWKKEQINEALLSGVLPCFMHGGEADEVVAKLEKVLNQKK